MSEEEDDRHRYRRTNILVMTIIIVLMIIGIALRWNFIKHEVAAACHRMFAPKEATSQ